MEEKSSWSNIITIPAIFAALGALMVFAGSFFKLVEFSAFSFSFPVYLKDLDIDNLVIMLRIVTLIEAAIVFIPKIPGIGYSACTVLLVALFVPKAYKAYNVYMQADDILNALGLSDYIDIGAFLKMRAGYHLMFVGFLLMIGMSIYFAVKFFHPDAADTAND